MTIPKMNSGINCRKLPCTTAKTPDEARIAIRGERYLPKDGIRNPRNMVSSHSGAQIDNKMKYSILGSVCPFASWTSVLFGNPFASFGNHTMILVPSQSTSGIDMHEIKTWIHQRPLKRNGNNPLARSGVYSRRDCLKIKNVAPSIEISSPRVKAARPLGEISASDVTPKNHMPTFHMDDRNAKKATNQRNITWTVFQIPQGTTG